MMKPGISAITGTRLRIVAKGDEPVQVGPDTIQIREDEQPLLERGVQMQVRVERGIRSVEAVVVDTGELIASEWHYVLTLAAACDHLGITPDQLPAIAA